MLLANDRKLWRTKALGNVMMARDIADAYGGDRLDYLRTANQTLRRKIKISKLAVNVSPQYIKEETNVRIPERLENLAPVRNRRNNNRKSNRWFLPRFGNDEAFAT